MKIHLYTYTPGHTSRRLELPIFSYCYGDQVKQYDKDVVVRMGNGMDIMDKDHKPVEFKNVLNPANAIQLNCSKRDALKVMSQVVKTPKIYDGLIPKGKTAVMRVLDHSAGRGFELVKGPKRFDKERFYATELIRTKVEYRVWFCGLRVLCARRVSRKATKHIGACRSNWSYRFRGTPKTLRTMTLRAAKAVNLDCGAADILYAKGHYHLLELNSAPSIDAKRIRVFFQKGLPALAKRRFPNLT